MRELRRIDEILGFSLSARDGDIGKVADIFFDDESWTVRYLVVNTGGWLHGRGVLIAPRAINGVDYVGRSIAVDLAREQVENSPPVDTRQPVSRHYEAEFHRHYGWDPYWTIAGSFGGPVPAVPPVAPPADSVKIEPPKYPHLRAGGEIRGYRVRARDVEFGEVEDFIVDDRDWRIQYIVFDTRRWLPGRKVLLAPAWVQSISWSARDIVVDLDAETIRTAPDYDPSALITPDYEVRLYGHYGKAVPAEGSA